jgi:hypothetical protein
MNMSVNETHGEDPGMDEPVAYRVVTGDSRTSVLRALAWVGCLVAAGRIISGSISFWAMGVFGVTPAGGAAAPASYSTNQIRVTIGFAACSIILGITLLGICVRLLQLKKDLIPLWRICEICAATMVIASQIFSFVWMANSRSVTPATPETYFVYLIFYELVRGIAALSYPIITIAIITVEMREIDAP